MCAEVDILTFQELNELTRLPNVKGAYDGPFQNKEASQKLWQRLLRTVHDPSVSDKHMTAACNSICFAVRAFSRSDDHEMRSLAYSARTWDQVFAAAQSAFASGKIKPALQVLDTLAFLAESNPSRSVAVPCVSGVAYNMLRIVYVQKPRKHLKEACIVLCFLLRKLSDFMSFSDVTQQCYAEAKPAFLQLCRKSGMRLQPSDAEGHAGLLPLILALLLALEVAESKSATLKLLSSLCLRAPAKVGNDILKVISQALDTYSSADGVSLDDTTRDVFPAILTTQDHFHAFLSKSSSISMINASAITLLLAQLKFGKLKGYVTEQEILRNINTLLYRNDTSHLDSTIDAYHGFRRLLSSSSPAIRQSACDLLICSSSSNLRITTAALDVLTESLVDLHDEADAFYRGELFSIFRRFLTRVCQHRSAVHKSENGEHPERLAHIDAFLQTYVEFLTAELAPHLSYGRHILALDILCFVAEAFPDCSMAFSHSIVASGEIQRCLFRLILDPYDDVRAMSAKALSYSLSRSDELPIFEKTAGRVSLLNSISSLAAATNRADHADALGRVISLLAKAKVQTSQHQQYQSWSNETLRLADNVHEHILTTSSFNVASRYPLHGKLLGISYVLQGSPTFRGVQDSPLQTSLLSICYRIWALSQRHLCVDSPEMETETTDETTDAGPKDQLAYAWRALRDSNLLMQAMLNHFETDLALLRDIGKLCFNQLRLLRHRGAFSTVSQTFLLCCQKARGVAEGKAEHLVTDWFEQALIELDRQADRLTRRSAGLPAIFAAVIDPSDRSSFLSSFIALTNIAAQPYMKFATTDAQNRIRLAQVHALNCMKDIMTNSRFRSMTEPLVNTTIDIAATCMASSVWAIKNCGLMLLRASISRLDPDTGLGAAEAGLDIREGPRKDRTSLSAAKLLLGDPMVWPDDKEYFAGSTEAEFAGLDLLGRLHIEEHDQHDAQHLVTQRLGHRLWHIRAQAARTLAGKTSSDDHLSTIAAILSSISSATSRNGRHGHWMAVRCLLEGMDQHAGAGELVSEVIRPLGRKQTISYISNGASSTSVLLEIITILLRYSTPGAQTTDLLDIAETVLSQPRSGADTCALLSRATAILYLQICSDGTADRTERFLLAMQEDEDTAAAVFKYIQSRPKAQTGTGTHAALIQLLVKAVSDDLRAAAMNEISSTVHAQNLALSLDEASILVRQLDFRSSVSREVMLGQLKLYAILCAQSWKHGYDEMVKPLRALGKGFCLHLRAAADDQYDDYTRKSAVEALLLWTTTNDINSTMSSVLEDTGELEIISVLYDLLNDDDDEIRTDAARFAASFCEVNNKVVPGILSISSAISSRQKLRSLLMQRHGNTSNFALECLWRLLDIKVTTSISRRSAAIRNYLGTYSIRNRLDEIRATANDLFAEEKQNLYIDGLAELKAWGQMLFMQKYLPCDLKEEVLFWASEGLQSFDAFLENLREHLKGGYDADLEDMLVRVVTVARIFDTSSSMLQHLHQRCLHLHLPAPVLAAFTWSLQ